MFGAGGCFLQLRLLFEFHPLHDPFNDSTFRHLIRELLRHLAFGPETFQLKCQGKGRKLKKMNRTNWHLKCIEIQEIYLLPTL